MKTRITVSPVFALAFLVLGFLAGTASAATWTVTKTADTNDGTCDADCSLREAIVRSNQTPASDTIVFSALFNSSQTVTLTLGELSLTTTIVIEGPGARLLTVSGNGASRVFDNTGSVTLNNFAIRNGNGANGGGILNAGNLVMANMTVAGNIANAGAGIYSTGTLNLSGSTVSGNSLAISAVGRSGGGLDLVGGTATISNSTISGNSATGLGQGGGGMSVTGGAVVNMNNVTIVNNLAESAGAGAGIFIVSLSSVNLRNCLIADNTSSGTPDDAATPTPLVPFTSNGNNLVESPQPGRGFTNGVSNDIIGLDPNISATLSNYGGPTDTHAVRPGSLAIDAGNSCVFTGTCGVNNVISLNDQRGSGFSRLVGANVDIGAFEFVAPTAASVTISGRLIDERGRGIYGAYVIATSMDGSTQLSRTSSFGYFSFDGFEAGQSVVLSLSSKRYSFEPQLLALEESITDLVIVGYSK